MSDTTTIVYSPEEYRIRQEVNEYPIILGSTVALSGEFVFRDGSTPLTDDWPVGGFGLSEVSTFGFDTTYTPTGAEAIGTRYWDVDNLTTSLVLPNGGLLQDGQELYALSTNLSGGDVLDGVAVSSTSASGNRIAFTLTDPSNEANSCAFLGLTTEPIAKNNIGRVTIAGEVHGLNTLAFTEGLPVYVNPSSPGQLTQTIPAASKNKVIVGIVSVRHGTEGVITLTKRVIPKFRNLSDVNDTFTTSGQIPAWNQAASYFEAVDQHQLFTAENKTGGNTFAGQVLARHSSGAGVTAAVASGISTAAVGLAYEVKANGVAVRVQTFGRLTLTDWTATTGAANLSALADYYLDTTAGKLTAIPPTTGGTITQRIGRALSSQTLEIVLDLVVRN